jgi:hypothetical protein
LDGFVPTVPNQALDPALPGAVIASTQPKEYHRNLESPLGNYI